MKKRIIFLFLMAVWLGVGCDKSDREEGPVEMSDDFEAYCLAQFDTNGDGRLEESELRAVKRIVLTDFSGESLSGIERFQWLDTLILYGNRLQALNLNGNRSLKYLFLISENLRTLQVEACTSLNRLILGSRMDRLDFTANRSLEYLDVSDSLATSIDIRGLDRLTELHLSGVRLESIDLSGCTSLKQFYSASSHWGDLSFPDQQLEVLSLVDCPFLQDIDVSGQSELERLHCDRTPLKKLRFGENGRLAEVRLLKTELRRLDVSGLSGLKRLECPEGQLSELELGERSGLERLVCTKNRLETLDLSAVPLLQELYCGRNYFTSLDVSGLPDLIRLVCDDCTNLKTLILNNHRLRMLECRYCYELRGLDLSSCSDLEVLNCYCGGKFEKSGLSLEHNTKLRYLNCLYTGVKTLDLSPCPALETLICYPFEVLDISGNRKLTELRCNYDDSVPGSPPIARTIYVWDSFDPAAFTTLRVPEGTRFDKR